MPSELIYSEIENLYPLINISFPLYFTIPSSLVTIILFSINMNSNFLYSTYKWDHAILSFCIGLEYILLASYYNADYSIY